MRDGEGWGLGSAQTLEAMTSHFAPISVWVTYGREARWPFLDGQGTVTTLTFHEGLSWNDMAC